MNISKIGFACKIYTRDDTEQLYNFNTTTVKHLATLTIAEQRDKIQKLSLNNVLKLRVLSEYVNTFPEMLKMFRIGSDLLPLYTHSLCESIYKDRGFIKEISEILSDIGTFCRLNHIRLSMHPGQFTVLGSNNANTVKNSIAELEYHTDIFRWLGYQGWHDHDIAINIHGGSKNVPLSTFLTNMNQCSQDCKDWLTVENDEFSFGLTELVAISDKISIVPDLHHYWIKTGEYLDVNSWMIKDVISSWRGRKPKLHCAMSREELYVSDINELPDFKVCLANGLNKTKLRAHSDACWNTALLNYYSEFLGMFDIMCEMKWKQVGARQFYDYLK